MAILIILRRPHYGYIFKYNAEDEIIKDNWRVATLKLIEELGIEPEILEALEGRRFVYDSESLEKGWLSK